MHRLRTGEGDYAQSAVPPLGLAARSGADRV